jgi:ADP-ribose pyrophosphatase
MSKQRFEQLGAPALSALHVDRGGTVLIFPASVVVAAMEADGKVAMVRQFRPSASRMTIELPGGRIEPAETPEAAAHREFKEETGLRCVGLKRLFKLNMDFSVSRHETYVLTGRMNLVPRDSAPFELVLLTLTRALAMVTNGSITHAPTVAAVLWLTRQQRRRR